MIQKEDILSRLDYRTFYKSFLPSLKDNGKVEAQVLCPFHDDHNPSLSVNLETGLFHCFGCGAKGDVITFYERYKDVDFKTALAEIARMVGVETGPSKVVAIYEYKDATGKILYRKKRYEPGWTGKGKDFTFEHKENGQWVKDKCCDSVPYNLLEVVKGKYVIFVEGEGKADLLKEWGLVATCLDSGSQSPWQNSYLPYFEGKEKVVVLPDNDVPGREYAQRIAKAVYGKVGEIKMVELPGLKEKEDIVDWQKKGGTKEQLTELIGATPAWSPPAIQRNSEWGGGVAVSAQFEPLSSQELIDILGQTIKRDEQNKLVTFLTMLSAYTESSQLNISNNAPSSTGKSYIPTEIATLFPEEDIIQVGYCSPTAFFHDVGEYDREKRTYSVNLSRKILIFLDQPHTLLLQHLRPLLSHDKKEIRLKITDKSQKAGLRTKNIILIGFPAVVFCTAGLKIDEQEATRFLLLSPEATQEKIREAIYEKIKKEADSEAYQTLLENEPKRKLLKDRIRAIREENIKDIKIGSPRKIEELFFSKNKVLKPRHQRDIGRVISLVKTFALLNLWSRERNGLNIVANKDDIYEAFRVWDVISESQEFNLPPYIYQLYKDVIFSAWAEKNQGRETFEEITGQLGLTRLDITRSHLQVYGRVLPDWLLRQQIIPMLENAGLINQEPDPKDRRKVLIYPTTPLTISAPKNIVSNMVG